MNLDVDFDYALLPTFEQLGGCASVDDIAVGLDRDVTESWVKHAEGRGWIRPFGSKWCITYAGRSRLVALTRAEASISVGVPDSQSPRRSLRKRLLGARR